MQNIREQIEALMPALQSNPELMNRWNNAENVDQAVACLVELATTLGQAPDPDAVRDYLVGAKERAQAAEDVSDQELAAISGGVDTSGLNDPPDFHAYNPSFTGGVRVG